MREAKFRGFSNDTGKWHFGHGHFLIKHTRDSGLEDYSVLHTESSPAYVVPESIGEYTSLIDQNGTEIYEGDIVIREMISGFSINEDFIGEVKIYECRWWIDNGQDAIPLWDEVDELKIIGNIYEHPELLGDTN